ncbi:MAG: HDOD domain-containing protein [Planctomycetota bacterium]
MAEAISNSTSILKLVNKTMELPTIPEVLVRLNDVIASEESSAEDVAKVISVDPAVSTNILRIVNSAYYGLQVRVSSIGLAVSIMGFTMTKKVALKAAVFSVFGKNQKTVDHFDPVAFWKHSIFTGVAARVLGLESSRFGSTDAEDLYICGLLHDIGKIIMMEKAGEQYRQVLAEAVKSGRPESEVEQEVFGFTHADVGSVLGVKWFLPEELTVAIRYHHQPSKDPFHRSLSSLIHLADHLAWCNGSPSTQGTMSSELDHEVYDQIGLDPQQVEDLLPQIRDDFQATGQPWE